MNSSQLLGKVVLFSLVLYQVRVYLTKPLENENIVVLQVNIVTWHTIFFCKKYLIFTVCFSLDPPNIFIYLYKIKIYGLLFSRYNVF